MKLELRPMLISGCVLAAFALAGAVALSGSHALTAPRIEANIRANLERQLNAVVPAALYDNVFTEDILQIDDPEQLAALGTRRTVTVFRARLGDAPAAAVFDVVTPDGYSGDIRLLVGVLPDGRVSGVRVVTHRETPGLGDAIELDRSNWILGFDGRSLGDPAAARWQVQRDGGDFDQFTGATITPRAVVRQVARVLAFAGEQGEKIYR